MRTATVLFLLLAACRDPVPAPAVPPPAQTAPKPPAPAPPPAEDPYECLDRVLKEAGLNAYGDPPGTVYAGATPLFDEATGRRLTLREYVFARRPDLLQKCPLP